MPAAPACAAFSRLTGSSGPNQRQVCSMQGLPGAFLAHPASLRNRPRRDLSPSRPERPHPLLRRLVRGDPFEAHELMPRPGELPLRVMARVELRAFRGDGERKAPFEM